MPTQPELRWTPARPNVLVVACSDGRLQEATDAFLELEFKIKRYDRFYVPGGGGALASTGSDPVRAQQMCAECKTWGAARSSTSVLIFNGPSAEGRIERRARISSQASWAKLEEISRPQEATRSFFSVGAANGRASGCDAFRARWSGGKLTFASRSDATFARQRAGGRGTHLIPAPTAIVSLWADRRSVSAKAPRNRAF